MRTRIVVLMAVLMEYIKLGKLQQVSMAMPDCAVHYYTRFYNACRPECNILILNCHKTKSAGSHLV